MKRVGILGLPQSGKTTVFEILLQGAGLTGSAAAARDVVGVVRVPDERVDRPPERGPTCSPGCEPAMP